MLNQILTHNQGRGLVKLAAVQCYQSFCEFVGAFFVCVNLSHLYLPVASLKMKPVENRDMAVYTLALICRSNLCSCTHYYVLFLSSASLSFLHSAYN